MVKFLLSSKAAKIPDKPSKHYLFNNKSNKNTRRRCKNMFKVNNKDTRTTSMTSSILRFLLLVVLTFKITRENFERKKSHIKLKELAIKKNFQFFNSIENTGETRSMNELEYKLCYAAFTF